MEENPPRRRRLSDAPNPTDPPLHDQHTSPSLPPPLVVPSHRHVHYSTTDDEDEEGDHNGIPWQEKVRAHRIAGAGKDSSLVPVAPVEVPLEQESTMDERETFAGGVGVSYLDGEVGNGNKRLPSPSPSPPPPPHLPIPATTVLARRERRQEKRSMTLPDEFMNGAGAGGVPLDKLDTSEGGYGFGFGPSVRRSSLRLAHGAGTAAATAAVANKNNNLVSSPSSDDQGSFRRDRQEHRHSSSSSPLAIGGPSRYPGMLQLQHPSSSSPLAMASVDSAAVSPRTVQRRRMVSSRGGSPDIEHRNRDGNGNGNASIPAPAARLRRRISSMDDLTAEAGASRRKSNSWNAKHDMLPATTTTKMKMGSGESTTTPTTLTPTSTRPPSRHRKESMMQAVHPINASSSSKTITHNNNGKQRQQGSRDTGGDGDNSSTHGPSGDESMNEEKQEFAKTVGRKRKQSEDFAVAADRLRHQHQHLHLQQHLHPSQPQRSMSTPVTMSAVPEFTEYGLQGNSTSNPPLMPQESKEKEPARTKKRSRRGVEGLGFEGTLEASQQRTQNDAASSAVLENLLQSIDLANAMRLIQKQTVIPSGVHDVNGTDAAANSHTIPVSPNARSTFRNSAKGNGKVAEMFVPVAPPPILNSPNQQDATPAMRHHKEAATAGGNGHGHVAFTHPAVEVSDSEDAHSVRSGNHHHHHHQYTHSPLPLPTQGRASRLSTSSSIPSGLFGSRRHVSTPTSLVSGNHNINNNTKAVESGTTKTQLFMAGAGAVPEPNNKHKRSISERFSLNRHLLGHGKKGKAVPVPAVERSLAGQVEVNEEVAMEAKDMAKFQERIQSSLLELSHHPRAEKLAYQARSYLQGYYSNVFASIRDRQLDPDPIYVFDPLAVIRWRRAVREEEAKRVAYEASRTSASASAKAFSPSSGTATLFDPRLRTPSKSTNSPDMSNGNGGRPPSRPLHSAELLNRVDQSDTAKHLKVSPALREWVVTPSEMVAYLNCKGVADHFVPSNEFEHPMWGDMPQIDRSPSTMTASSTHSRSMTSPTSRMWQIKATSNRPSSSAHGSEGGGEDRGLSHGRKESLETGDRFASVIKSPLQRIRRHIHPHLDRDHYPQSAVASDTENEGIKGSRRHALLYTAQRFKIGQASKEQVQHVETAPTMSHESIPKPQSSTTELSPPRKIDLHVDTLSGSGRLSPVAPTASTTARIDEFDKLAVEVNEEDYRKTLRTLQSVENAMNRTPVVEREGQALVKDFITTVENFRTRHGVSILDDDLRKMRQVQLGYVGLTRIPQVNGQASGNGAATGKPAKMEQNTSGQELSETTQVSAFNPLNAAREIIAELHERYNVAIRQAVEVCQQQDAVQRKVSELLPEAETLLSKIGDQVRKLRAIRESFYTLDAIRSNSNPAYYRVVNAGFWVVSWIVWAALLCVRYIRLALGVLKYLVACFVRLPTFVGMFFIRFGINIGECLRTAVLSFGSALTNMAFWVALFSGIVIGAIFFS